MINITNFRSNLKQYFDDASRGVVEIERDGKIYYLSSKPVSRDRAVEKLLVEILEEVKKKPVQDMYRPPQQERTDNVHISGQACCSRAKPCQHWAFNGEDAWVNMLTKERREIE